MISDDTTAGGSRPVLNRLRQLAQCLRVGYLCGLVVLIVWVLSTKHPEITDMLRGARAGWIAASLAASFGFIWIGAWFWTVSLRLQGVRPPEGTHVFGANLLATSRSLLARYVPGQVWFTVGRAGLLRNVGFPTGPLVVTAVLEMATSMTVAVASGLAVMGVWVETPVGTGWLIGLAAACFVFASPPVGGRAAVWALSRRGVDITFTWSGYFKMVGVNAVFWGWSVLTFLCYFRAFPSTDVYGLAETASGFLITWAAGFAALFAPQGIGVFEAGMATILQADAAASLALVLGGYRLVLLIRDLIAVAAAEAVVFWKKKNGTKRRVAGRSA